MQPILRLLSHDCTDLRTALEEVEMLHAKCPILQANIPPSKKEHPWLQSDLKKCPTDTVLLDLKKVRVHMWLNKCAIFPDGRC